MSPELPNEPFLSPVQPENLIYDPLTGIVTFLGDRECDPTDPAVFIVAAQSADLCVLGFATTESRIVGSGAGLSYEHAFWAAAGETVERYCAAIVPTEDFILGSYEELSKRNIPAVSPDRWALFHPSQFPALGIPQFTADVRLAWVKGRRLAVEEDCYLPACLTYLSPGINNYTAEGAEVVGPATSTGLACAQSALEATLKGLCEVIERDAFIIRWRNALPCTRINIDPASAIYTTYMEKFVRPGLEYTIFETSLDLPFHSFLGVLHDRRHSPARILVGGACHPDPNRAVLKTLIELAQGFQWANHVRTRKIELDAEFSAITSFESRMELYVFGDQHQAFDFLFDNPDTMDLSQLESEDRGDMEKTLGEGVSRLQEMGLDAIAVDMTTIDAEDCGMAVVKVVIPECEALEGDHRMQFLGGRRWREAPVRLGLRQKAITLGERNQQPHPYP
jgi:ribosomal protein S12 methylthiotransferase accessory factor